jgi:hypothetical protein
VLTEQRRDDALAEPSAERRRDCIPHLTILVDHAAAELKGVAESLESGAFPEAEWSVKPRVNKVTSVVEIGENRRGRSMP